MENITNKITHFKAYNTSPNIIHSPPPLKVQSLHKNKDHTDIIDSGASGFYISKNAPTINFDPTAPKIIVGTASSQLQQSSGAAKLVIPNLPLDFTRASKVMSSFHYSLIGLGPI